MEALDWITIGRKPPPIQRANLILIGHAARHAMVA